MQGATSRFKWLGSTDTAAAQDKVHCFELLGTEESGRVKMTRLSNVNTFQKQAPVAAKKSVMFATSDSEEEDEDDDDDDDKEPTPPKKKPAPSLLPQWVKTAINTRPLNQDQVKMQPSPPPRAPQQSQKPPPQPQQQQQQQQELPGDNLVRLVTRALASCGMDYSRVIDAIGRFNRLPREDRENYGASILELVAAGAPGEMLQQYLQDIFGQ